MRLILLIIKKFLSSRKEKKYISRLSFFSYILVAIGVAVPVLVLSVTNGFQGMVEKRVVNYDFHGQAFFSALIGQESLQNFSNFDVFGFYEDKCLLKSKRTSKVTQIRAFTPHDFIEAPMFREYQLIAGEKLPKKGGIILGENLAYALKVGIDDEIKIIALDNSLGYNSYTQQSLRVDGVISLGYANYDTMVSFITKEDADKIFLIQKDAFNKVGFLSKTKQSKQEILKALKPIQKTYSQGVFLKTFDNRVFKDFEEEKKSLTLAMFMIIFISFLAIFITLNVVLADKIVDVGLLKTLGITKNTMIQIFLGQGVFIAFIGITIGFFLGALITVNLELLIGVWEAFINHLMQVGNLIGITHFPPYEKYQMMPEEVFYINSLPYDLQMGDFIIQGVGAFLLSLIAAVSPALKVTKTQAAQILRKD